ncbi:MAG: hypothetical protein JXB18_04620 [Sedimentisphaerales bacterium]|nr:hypothetical protein [Sedimentisphaerales bacterium]
MTSLIRFSTLVLLGLFSGFAVAQNDMSELAQEMAEAQAEIMEAQQEALDAAREAQQAAMEAQAEAQQAARETQGNALAEQGQAIGLAAGKMAGDLVGSIRGKMPHYMGGMGGGWAASSSPFADNPSSLIIPGQKTTSETIRQIREDMRVMSQIWDDTVNPDAQQGWFTMHFVGGLFNTNTMTSQIFIGDYGVIFLQNVDFPLMPTNQIEAEAQPKDPAADEVWQKTKKKLQGQPVDEPPYPNQGEAYDADKVEALKEKCIKAFRHAANIRNLETQQWVVLVIRCTTQDDIMPVEEENAETSTDNASTLMLRAVKKDIDAFAKNPDNLEQFRKAVQILTY